MFDSFEYELTTPSRSSSSSSSSFFSRRSQNDYARFLDGTNSYNGKQTRVELLKYNNNRMEYDADQEEEDDDNDDDNPDDVAEKNSIDSTKKWPVHNAATLISDYYEEFTKASLLTYF